MIDEKTLKEGYKLDFAGAFPNLSITVNNILPSDLKNYISYTLTKNENEVGGKVVINVNANEKSLENAGYTLAKDNIEFTEELKEEKFSHYINDLSKIDTKTKKDIIKQFSDLALAKISKGLNDDISDISYAEDLKFEKIETIYLLSTKPGMKPDRGNYWKSYEIYNQVVALIKVSGKTGKYRDKLSSDDNLYIVAMADNIIKNPDGTNKFELSKTSANDYLMRKEDIIKKYIHAYSGNYNINQEKMEEFIKN